MSNWRFRRRTLPLTRRGTYPRVEAIPIANIGVLLRSITNVMNEIQPSDDFDAVLATRLYYAVMCRKRCFPEWGVTMRPHYLRNTGSVEQDREFHDTGNDSETEPLITDV